MPTTLSNYSIFIASPSGLEEVRNTFRTTVQEYNDTDANHRNVHFTPVGWEETLGGVGRPQSLINEEIKKCDLFILVLHDRWGSPSGTSIDPKYSSGTEEEFAIALDCYSNPDHSMQDIVLFFLGVNERQLSDPGEQLRKVLAFRKEREDRKDLLFHTFDTKEKFRDLLLRHLAKWVRDHENSIKKHPLQFPISLGSAALAEVPNLQNIEGEADSALAHVETLVEKGQFVEAEIAFSKLVVKGDDPEALAHYGKFLRKTGQLGRAKELIEEAIRKSSQPTMLRTRAYATLQLARIEEDRGNVVDATDLFRQANVQFEMSGDKEGVAKTQRNLGKVLKKRGQMDDAEYALRKAAELYKDIGDNFGQASALGYLGLVFKSRGRFKEAEQAHRSALQIHERSGNRKGEAIVWGNLGTVLRLQGKVEEAVNLHRNALEVYESLHDRQGIARELSNLGTASRYLDKFDESRAYHDKSLKISEELGNQHGIAIQLSCIGQVSIALEEYEEAERYHLRSLSISEQIGDKQGAAMQYKNLGTIYRLTNDLGKAEDAIRKGLSIDLDNGFMFGVGKSKEELGKIMVLKKKLDHAKRLFSEAQSAYLESGAQPSIEKMDRLIELIDSEDWEAVVDSL